MVKRKNPNKCPRPWNLGGTFHRWPSFHDMRRMIRLSVLVSALLFNGVAAVAQVGVIEPDRTPQPADPHHPAILDFSMQQRAAIYRSVVAAAKERRAARLPFDTQITIGGVVPNDARLEPLPEEVRDRIAAANNTGTQCGTIRYCWWIHAAKPSPTFCTITCCAIINHKCRLTNSSDALPGLF
jgi:hypothetical protein